MNPKRNLRYFKHINKKVKTKRVFRPHVRVCSESDWPFPKRVCAPGQEIKKK